ncbi:PREDICTED: leukocyte receptor cluster member 9 isoform X2 [Cyprinodon variegatus]|uniref:Leukocyte receptor cluster member 9 n=1 Tax=Cyprinodon variegatus TaxID=28743 RepID=A0A3Q2CLP0_CYPVA|nr:PREDICTED: leukocyte receptor cluster member 9 isoform X2 [Cyprinodon variegatus]
MDPGTIDTNIGVQVAESVYFTTPLLANVNKPSESLPDLQMASESPSAALNCTENQRDGDGSSLTPITLTDSQESNAVLETDRDTMESAEQKEESKVCQFFQMGKCRFGSKCRLSHSDSSPYESAAPSADMDDQQNVENLEKHNKKKGTVNKGAKPRDNKDKDVNKKPRMRTADDVISRILWDPSVEASDFVVGYIDRFLGILERPFCEFNWDTNPCDCDYSTELALPRHRIQYFAYKGHHVWDRHSRTDRVFGSTGQSLAPPFGKEEEVKEENHAEDQEEQDVGSEKTEEQTGAAGGQDEGETPTRTRHEEELEEIPASQKQKETCGSCVAEEAENRIQPSSEQESSFQEKVMKLKEEEEEQLDEACEESLEAGKETQNPSLKQAEQKSGSRPPKKKPTHFITFRANTPAILSSFQQLQEELTALLPSSAPYWHAASMLHVTLCLLVLDGPAEVAAAAEILRRFAQLDRNPPVAVTFPRKLKHFNGKVLYLSPSPRLSLHQLNSGLQEAYRKEGWLHRQSYNPQYHLTLAKVDKSEEERIFEGVGDLKVGKGLNFGRLPVNTLHLCNMGGSGLNGFYDIVCTVTLR